MAYAIAALAAAGHALLNKRDPRSAWAWITACWLFPLGGALLYWWFGINRVHQRARREFGPGPGIHPAREPLSLPDLPETVPQELIELVRMGGRMSGHELLPHNAVLTLHNGEEAYPAMLAAIERAERTIWLMSYIFAGDRTGTAFADSLARAQQRGVQVRVLLDGIGEFLWRPRGEAVLRARGIPTARFFPIRWWPPMLHVNLRNHRKLLLVDGRTAFAGGMNIGDHHLAGRDHHTANTDLHFQIIGPVVRQLAAVFADDWQHSCGEMLIPSDDVAERGGSTWCRVITDGPNDGVDRLQLLLLAAMANAHHSIRIMTPYFSPTHDLVGALQAAALRGVEVSLIVPERGDQPWLDATARRWIAQMAEFPIRFYLRPAPFAHTKLFLIDDYYSLLGSANLDCRSLRLNFELMVECYDGRLSAELRQHFDAVKGASVQVSATDRPSLPRRLLDSICWLFSPYL